jgi:hypothetical protein
MRKHGLRGLGLALITALGLMAFSASAQAITLKEGGWLKSNGTYLAAATAEKIKGEQAATGLLELPAKNAAILCEKALVEEGSIENKKKITVKTDEGEGHGKAKLLFLKCKVFDFTGGVVGKELTACTEALEAPLADKTNKHITTTVLILLHKHVPNGLFYLLLEPLLGKTAFVTLTFGGACALPEELTIKGSVSCEILPQTPDQTQYTFDIDLLAAAGQCGDDFRKLTGSPGLSFGGSPAYLKGKAVVELESKVAFGAM